MPKILYFGYYYQSTQLTYIMKYLKYTKKKKNVENMHFYFNNKLYSFFFVDEKINRKKKSKKG